MEPKYKRVVLKISGEALAGDNKTGISDEMLETVARQVKEITPQTSRSCSDWDSRNTKPSACSSSENFFERCNTLLNNQGYFAFSTFGKENMKEIRELTGNGLPYRSREELEVALSPHFDILYSEEELIPLSFEDPIKVLYHLKQTGVNGLSTQSSPTGKQENDLCSSDNNSKNNSRTNSKNNSKNNLPQQQWTRRDLQLFCERYTQEFTQGASVSLTYHLE